MDKPSIPAILRHLQAGIVLGLLYLCLSGPGVRAQSTFTVTGMVTDTSGHPLEDMQVSLVRTDLSTFTNKDGGFRLRVKPKEGHLHISGPGYRSRVIAYKAETGDSLIDLGHLRMVPYEYRLDTVSISAQRDIALVADDPNHYILDYEIVDGEFLFYELKGGRYRLARHHPKDLLRIPMETETRFLGLKKSCAGDLYAFTRDSVWQVLFHADGLRLSLPITMAQFERGVEPCACQMDDIFVIREYFEMNQAVAYSLATRDSLIGRLAYLSHHEKAMANYEEAAFLRNGGLQGMHVQSAMETPVAGDLWNARRLQERGWYLNKIQSAAVYCPIIPMGDSLYLFDHIHDSLYVYGPSFTIQRRVSISYHKERFWEEEVFANEEGTELFTLYNRNGYYEIARIDPVTGSVTERVELKEHTFPRKIRIKNGNVYYLYRGDDDGYIHSLYVQPCPGCSEGP